MEFDPSQNYLDKEAHPLRFFFEPQSVAVIGAKEEVGSVGRTVLSNLLATFKGRLYPVNPKYPEVLGLRAYPTAKDLPEAVDLAVIVTPAKLIPSLIDDCAARGIRSVVVISAGFKEVGSEGEALELEVLTRAKRGGIRIIGPNCLGIMNPHAGLNATFAAGMALPGRLAFLSQSGALCTAVLDWSLKKKIGFSAFASMGSMADIGWGDLIDYFGSDAKTEAILIYMESVGEARKFLSAARSVVLRKPIILIKPGKTAAAAKAAASHTGSLAGADEIFDSAIQRVGMLRVNTIDELFDMAGVLASQPRPQGPRLAIVTNAGGPAVLATDAAILGGASLTSLQPSTVEALSEFLPKAWSHGNPVDILGDAGSERYAKALQVVEGDPGVDAVLVILTPQAMTKSTETASLLQRGSKPLLASWMGAESVREGLELLNERKIATFSYPDSAAKTFALMWKVSDNLKLLYETPMLRDEVKEEDLATDKAIEKELAAIADSGRVLLTEDESKRILAAYGIPVVESCVATNEEEAVRESKRLGFPVVLKLHSLKITHKSDVGGVKLNLRHDDEVRKAFSAIRGAVSAEDFQGVSVQKMIQLREGFEVIVGSLVDPQFGPIVLFGTGGELVEVYGDKAMEIPPLTATLARRLVERTKIGKALKGARSKKGVNLEKLEAILIRFSRLILQQRRIAECDINPLFVSSEGILALDARIVLHPEGAVIPRPAIRPYPIEYLSTFVLGNKKRATLRPMRPEDEPLLTTFHRELSEETVRERYFAFLTLEERIAHERLIEICHTDYDREVVLVAEVEGAIVAVLRIWKRGVSKGELKMVTIDRMQRQGLGSEMLKRGLEIACAEGIKEVEAHILEENVGMLKLCRRFGFSERRSGQHPNVISAYVRIPQESGP